MWIRILVVFLVLFNLAGCATTRKDVKKPQAEQLQAQISDLEAQLRQRDDEIQSLESELAKAQTLKTKDSTTTSSSKGSSKEIQAALKNAGFYDGPIDGKIGANTKKGIKAFQEANGLVSDGVVGSKTWVKLKGYLK